MWFSGLPAPFLRLGPNWLFPWAAYAMPRGGSLLAMVLSSLPATEGKVVRAPPRSAESDLRHAGVRAPSPELALRRVSAVRPHTPTLDSK